LRKAEWIEFDLDAAQWRMPPARMKRTKREKLSGAAKGGRASPRALSVGDTTW
jgi:hypothetical protein